jgi:hypothetical protein
MLPHLSDSHNPIKEDIEPKSYESHRLSTQSVKKKGVIPVKTGIQILNGLLSLPGWILDSRFCGNHNDRYLDRRTG